MTTSVQKTGLNTDKTNSFSDVFHKAKPIAMSLATVWSHLHNLSLDTFVEQGSNLASVISDMIPEDWVQECIEQPLVGDGGHLLLGGILTATAGALHCLNAHNRLVNLKKLCESIDGIKEEIERITPEYLQAIAEATKASKKFNNKLKKNKLTSVDCKKYSLDMRKTKLRLDAVLLKVDAMLATIVREVKEAKKQEGDAQWSILGASTTIGSGSLFVIGGISTGPAGWLGLVGISLAAAGTGASIVALSLEIINLKEAARILEDAQKVQTGLEAMSKNLRDHIKALSEVIAKFAEKEAELTSSTSSSDSE